MRSQWNKHNPYQEVDAFTHSLVNTKENAHAGAGPGFEKGGGGGGGSI